MVRIWIGMVRILFEWFEFAFKCFKSHWSGLNLHSKASKSFESRSNGLNRVKVVRICNRMFRIPFEWFEFAFEYFESPSNGSNLHSNASNPIGVVWICIRRLQNPLNPVRMVWIALKWFEFAIECFESHSSGSNLHSNTLNPLRMVRICIPMLQIPLEWFEFAFEGFKILWIPFEWFESR